MSFFICTGKLGSGKTLVGVGLIRDALAQGRRVATNIDLFLEEMLSWSNRKAQVYRLPDLLSRQAFEDVGVGNPDYQIVRGRPMYDEKKNGLMVLDEAGLSMNSRDYRDEGRSEFIKWCVHSRKLGWDLMIIIQHYDALDKQIRDMFGEHVVYCTRMDRVRLPIIGGIMQYFGMRGNLGQLHFATCKYGTSPRDPVAWRKIFRGRDLWFSYDTRQQFFPSEDEAVYQVLPPWYTKGRYVDNAASIKNLWHKVYTETLGAPVSPVLVFFLAVSLGFWSHMKMVGVPVPVVEKPVSVSLPLVGPPVVDKRVLSDPERESVQDVPVDPWEGAYISTYVGLASGVGSYKFRSALGEVLDLPRGSSLLPHSACHAVLVVSDRQYTLRCSRI
jgi:hypothetical protein